VKFHGGGTGECEYEPSSCIGASNGVALRSFAEVRLAKISDHRLDTGIKPRYDYYREIILPPRTKYGPGTSIYTAMYTMDETLVHDGGDFKLVTSSDKIPSGGGYRNHPQQLH
jgi:hypothetical protein